MFPDKLHKKLLARTENKSLRVLGSSNDVIDFSSNDYLGFAKSEAIFNEAHQYLLDSRFKVNGATGSRLLSGNYSLYNELELKLSNYHHSESALLFNSGYNANLGLFSSVPQRGDIILYDEYAHASIRDGIKLSNAKAYKFQHNNLDDLERLLSSYSKDTVVYVVTESVFSMDGDSPDLSAMLRISNTYNAHLIIDEAHAVGVFGFGLVQELALEKEVFARIITFGKALGCHGALVVGSKILVDYLVNFSRPFIYTTGLSPHSLATIKYAYQELLFSREHEKLHFNIKDFRKEMERLSLNNRFIKSNSAIQSCVIPGNERVKSIAFQLQKHGFDVKPILSPTVPNGEERLRFCLHSYNTQAQIAKVLTLLCKFV